MIKTQIMIDLLLYRYRIGCYKGSVPKKTGKAGTNYDYDSRTKRFKYPSGNTFCFIFWVVTLFLLLSISLSMLIICYFNKHILLPSRTDNFSYMVYPSGNVKWCLPFLSIVYIKLAFLVLFLKIFQRFFKGSFDRYSCISRLSTCIIGHRPSRFKSVLIKLFLALLAVNFLSIAIVNPSLMNPGPQNLNVCYQNVRGLIPFSNLSQSHPNLDITKIYELNAYISNNKPDIVLLSETWLKKSIKDREVIFDNCYNVYRSDRSQLSHPCDPNNPTKYKKYGGGVLIAARSDIDARLKRISMRHGAEIVAIEISVDNVKFIFCVVYRVGTLGLDNHKSIIDSIKPFYKGKKAKKIFILGDFNLSNVTWPYTDNVNSYISPVEKLFVDSFNDFGLTQCITEPTHSKRKTLDLLLTNSPALINNLAVNASGSICNSDHYPVFLKVKANLRLKKPPKEKSTISRGQTGMH